MRKHSHQGPRAARPPKAPKVPKPRARRHPLTLAFGLVLVAVVVGATVFAVRALYSDYSWHAEAQSAATQVARAIQFYSARDDSTPEPVDAVAANPETGQTTIAQLPYGEDIPAEVTRIRVGAGGALSVLTTSGALCSGVTFSMTAPGRAPSGSLSCGDALPPPSPQGLTATPRDASVDLEWPHPPAPVEDYTVSFSANDGATWTEVDDGISSGSRATVRNLRNGYSYLFRVAAVNLIGESPTATAGATPFTTPDPPTNVHAVGGFSAVVSWRPPAEDGGRPVTGYLVKGDPLGTCIAAATARRCEVTDLPGAAGYTFTVRALNEAGSGVPSDPATAPVAVYSIPDRPVALTAAPGNGLVLLTWTAPLRDGNTPITDYRVEYRAGDELEWSAVGHPASTDTARAIGGLTNGTQYEFRVMAMNAAGMSAPPLSRVFETPATIPTSVPLVTTTDGDGSVTLTWSAPVSDGDSPVTDYSVQFHAKGVPWADVDHPTSPTLNLAVGDLVNGTRYAFRVAAVNRMGQGPWSTRVIASPFGPPGPVVDPAAVGSLTAIDLSWDRPASNGGRALRGYRVEYKPSSSPAWSPSRRIPRRLTTATVGGLTAGDSYDFRIVALNEAGTGPSTPDNTDRPTLAGVIADEMPPPPKRLTAVTGDQLVTLRWQASPAGPDSPITAYTVTGQPTGTCTAKRLTCVVRGLENGVAYSFTVTASNEHVTGDASQAVTATPRVFNAASGGIETTFTRGGRTYRVHTFTAGSTFVVTDASRSFDVLVVGGGGGSLTTADGAVAVGGGGGILEVGRARLPVGQLTVIVGGGGAPGAPGSGSALDGVGTASAGAAGSAATSEQSTATRSAITGIEVAYGGAGTGTSGPGVDGRGTGAGGPRSNRGGSGVVIIRYEVAP